MNKLDLDLSCSELADFPENPSIQLERFFGVLKFQQNGLDEMEYRSGNVMFLTNDPACRYVR
jgi:hypothetical protein